MTRKRKNSNIFKSCAVCEAPTQYSHYGVPSCFACKTFFRRIVLAEIRVQCKYNPTCDIFGGIICPSCRLDKCLLAGMNPRVIQFPSSAKAIESVDYLAERKQMLEEKYCQLPKVTTPTCINSSYCYEIDSLLYLEAKVRQLRESEYNPTFYFENIHEILEQPSELANSHKYEKPKNWPINMDNLRENYDYVFHELNTLSKRYKRNWLVVDIIITIETIKLLEYVAIINSELMEYFYAAQYRMNVLVYPDGFIPMKAITNSPDESREISQIEYKVYCQNENSIENANLNLVEYILLKSIIYCYSAIPGITEKGNRLLTEHRELYANLLLKYLQANMGEECPFLIEKYDAIQLHQDLLLAYPELQELQAKNFPLSQHLL
uniref:Nuclear receptor domain-containing protein n=1 Tax=Acrobeloides nanus TaxID=290746 RepID=A0A914DFV8_9BILA